MKTVVTIPSRGLKLFFICLFILTSLCAVPSLSVAATVEKEQVVYSFTSSQDEERFNALIHEVRCVVCQSQSIADSNAPLANDLRAKIYAMVVDKKSDDVIKAYLVKRYGEFILLRPRVYSVTLALWLFPFACLLVFYFLLRRFYK